VAPDFSRATTLMTCATSVGELRALNQKSTLCGTSASGDATPTTVMLTGSSANRIALPTIAGSLPNNLTHAPCEMTRRNGASRPAGTNSSRVNERPAAIGRPSRSKNPSAVPDNITLTGVPSSRINEASNGVK
jgi:hypothetical protein